MTRWSRDRPYRWPVVRWLFLAFWRAREREVDDLGWPTPETRGSPDYKRGKVTGLDPDLVVITETTESPYVCCGYCSAAMASWTARKGITHSMSGAAHPIRSQGGRPHDNGSRASELRDGARRAHDVTLDALARDEIPGVLRAGHAVVINLDYQDLPGWLQVQSGSFGHSCTLYGWRESDDCVGFFDPLWPEGARGAWATWSEVKGALWADGEHSGTVTSWSSAPPPKPPPADDCPDCPPAEEHTADELDQLEADAYARAILDRDRAWRGTLWVDQPRPAGAWEPVPGAPPDVLTRWGWFGRWGPLVEPLTWSGPDAIWDELRWS